MPTLACVIAESQLRSCRDDAWLDATAGSATVRSGPRERHRRDRGTRSCSRRGRPAAQARSPEHGCDGTPGSACRTRHILPVPVAIALLAASRWRCIPTSGRPECRRMAMAQRVIVAGVRAARASTVGILAVLALLPSGAWGAKLEPGVHVDPGSPAAAHPNEASAAGSSEEIELRPEHIQLGGSAHEQAHRQTLAD